MTDLPDHWNDRYRTIGADAVSWYEPAPRLSLAMLEFADVRDDRSVIDIGGGASSLAGRLVDRGTIDVTVLDISETALDVARAGMTEPDRVTWVTGDITEWEPTRTWDVWHDRAVFHFLTEPAQREHYRRSLGRGLSPSGTVCIATFAEDGPEQCSGLPVRRYRPEELLAELGNDLRPIASGRHLHTTPNGVVQPFSWVVASR